MASAGFDNYTGPYISDGKYQSSVEFGETKPIGEWAAWSRLHDSAFAHFDDYGHRTAANSLYAQRMGELGGTSQQAAAFFVTYGNQIKDSFVQIAKNTGYGVLGLVYSGAKNTYNLADYVSNEKRYKQEVLDYYRTDPKLGNPDYDPIAMRSGPRQDRGVALAQGKGIDLIKGKAYDEPGSKNMGNVIQNVKDKIDDREIRQILKDYDQQRNPEVRNCIGVQSCGPRQYKYVYSPSVKSLQSQLYINNGKRKKYKNRKINKIYVS